MSEYIRNQILGIADNFKALASMAGDIEQVARICTDTLKAGNKIMFCGNGGSAADSQHLAAELVGRYKLNRPAMNALALTVDTSILTAVGNDYGYETVFSRQLEGVGRPGDLLVGLSTSGNSRNIVLAMELARRMGRPDGGLDGPRRRRDERSCGVLHCRPFRCHEQHSGDAYCSGASGLRTG